MATRRSGSGWPSQQAMRASSRRRITNNPSAQALCQRIWAKAGQALSRRVCFILPAHTASAKLLCRLINLPLT